MAHINNPACHLRPCDRPELARGEAKAVLREVLDDCSLSEIQEAVHQVVQPVRRKDGQVHDAQGVPEREAILEGIPFKGHLHDIHIAQELYYECFRLHCRTFNPLRDLCLKRRVATAPCMDD